MSFFPLISLIVLIVSYHFFKKAAGTMSIFKPNIVSWIFFFEFFTLTFIGANLMMGNVPNYLIDRATPEAKIKAYWATCYAMVFTPLVMDFTQRAFLGGGIRQKVNAYFSTQLTKTNDQAVYWIFLSLIAAIATAYTYFITGRLTLIDALTNPVSGQSLDLFRQQAGRGFVGNQYFRNILSIFLAPFVSYIAYGYLRLYRRRIYLLWFLATFALSVLALTSDAQKAPIIFYFISLFFVRILINGRARRWELLLLGVGVIGLVGFTYIVFARISLSPDSLRGIISRIGMVQFAGMPLAMDVFPRQIPFLNGGGFPEWINRFIGVQHAEMSRLLMIVYNPRGVAQGTAGVINTFFIADAWANFGWVGMVIAPIWLGVLIQFTHNKLLTLPKTPVYVGVMGYFITAFRVTGGFIGFVWNPLWLFIILIILGGKVFGSRKSLRMINSGKHPQIIAQTPVLPNTPQDSTR